MLTEDEAATQAKVSAKTIRRLILAGRIRFVNYATGQARAKYRIPCDALADVRPPPELEAPTPPPPRSRARRGRQAPALNVKVW